MREGNRDFLMGGVERFGCARERFSIGSSSQEQLQIDRRSRGSEALAPETSKVGISDVQFASYFFFPGRRGGRCPQAFLRGKRKLAAFSRLFSRLAGGRSPLRPARAPIDTELDRLRQRGSRERGPKVLESPKTQRGIREVMTAAVAVFPVSFSSQ